MSNENIKEQEGGIDFSKTNPEGEFDAINHEEVITNVKDVHIIGDPNKLNEKIPERNHAGQTININPDAGNSSVPPKENNSGPQQSQEGNNIPPHDPNNFTRPKEEKFNQEFHDLPKNEKEQNALLAADAIIHGYSELKMAIPNALIVSEKKLKKMHNKGEINMFQPIRINKTTLDTIPVAILVQDYNKTVVTPFVTSEEFKNNVRPLLASVLQEEGIALTPKQLLVYYVGMDLATTAKNVISCASDRSELLNQLKENHKVYAATSQQGPMQPVVNTQPSSSVPTKEGDPIEVKSDLNTPAEIVKKVVANSKKRGRKAGSKSSKSPLTKRSYNKKPKEDSSLTITE